MTRLHYLRGVDARRADRAQMDIAQAKLRQRGAHAISVTIFDLSRLGFRAEWPHEVRVGQSFWLTIPSFAPLMAQAIWSKNFEIGCRFEEPIHPAVFRTLLMRYAPRQSRA